MRMKTVPCAALTSVQLCFTENHLHFFYYSTGDKFLKNTYMACNSETYNQEVVEVFISPNANDTTNYYEVTS